MRNFYIVLFLSIFFYRGNAQDFKFGKVSEEEVKETSHPKEPDADAAVLFRDQQTYFEVNSGGFTLITEIHERIKIYNKDGFDWATKEITYYQGKTDKEKVSKIDGYTYNLNNGKLEKEKLRKDGIFEEEMSDYKLKTTLTMPAVREGSVIEYKYTLRSPFVATIDMVPLQYTIPINKLKAEVRIPEFFGFKKYINPQSPLEFTIQEEVKNYSYNGASAHLTHKRTNYTVEGEDIPALKEEAYVDYLQNYAAFLKWELQYTRFPNSEVEYYAYTWESVTKHIFDEGEFSREIGRNGFFKKDVDELLKGVALPADKAKVIFDFVKSKVKWNGYAGFRAENGVRSAYKNGLGNVGDINLLLTGMLRYAGLKANPVLVSTPANGIPLFPTRSGFNYVLAGLELEYEVILLDATDETAAFGELPGRARNWQGRIIRENGSSDWVDLTPGYQSEYSSSLNLKLSEDFVITGKSTNILQGLHAKKYRENYAGMNVDSYLQVLEKGKGNIKISNIEKENGKEIGESLKEVYNFELSNGMEVINDKIYLKPLLFMALKENPFKADERAFPIFFDFPSVRSNVVNMMVPEGYSVESVPESIIYDLNNGAGTFKFVIHQNGNFLRIESTLDMKNIVYTSNDYEALKKFYGQMVEKHSEAIVLSRS